MALNEVNAEVAHLEERDRAERPGASGAPELCAWAGAVYLADPLASDPRQVDRGRAWYRCLRKARPRSHRARAHQKRPGELGVIPGSLEERGRRPADPRSRGRGGQVRAGIRCSRRAQRARPRHRPAPGLEREAVWRNGGGTVDAATSSERRGARVCTASVAAAPSVQRRPRVARGRCRASTVCPDVHADPDRIQRDRDHGGGGNSCRGCPRWHGRVCGYLLRVRQARHRRPRRQ